MSLPGPGQQLQLPQKRPSVPSQGPQGKSLPLLVNTLGSHSMHGTVNCCFTGATGSFLWFLALFSIHLFTTYLTLVLPKPLLASLWLQAEHNRSASGFAAKQSSCRYR